MSDLIRLDDVTVRFGSLLALDHVSISVRAGEIVQLNGPNGAGKSTAIRVVTGELKPTLGRVEIAGLTPADAKSQFGALPDKDNHFEEFTARRNLAFFAALYDVPEPRIDEALGLVELETVANRPVREFSLGMRRRLLFARAFLHKPRVLLLDEPLANLDVSGQATVKEVLQKARGNGAAILYTSPGLHQAPFADRIVILERGKVVSTGNVEMK